MGHARPLHDDLRQVRLDLGLSQREMAEQLGLRRESVSRIEGGRPVLHSTVMRYLELAPQLTPHDILRGTRDSAPIASVRLWNWFRDRHGIAADQLRFSVSAEQRISVEITGARMLGSESLESVSATALMRAVYCGSRSLLSKIHAPADLSELIHMGHDEGPGERHEWAFSGNTLSYSAELHESAPDALDLDLPVKELLLESAQQSAEVFFPRLSIWPATSPPGERDISSRLYPRRDAPSESDGRATVTLQNPLPGLKYRLAWYDSEDRSNRPSLSAGGAIALARGRSVLNCLTAAKLAKVSRTTARRIEAGKPVTAQNLIRYARVIPGIEPQQVFPAQPPVTVLKDREAWEEMRQVHGVSAEEVSKTMSIDANGQGHSVIQTLQLRPLKGDVRDLRMRLGIGKHLQLSPSSMEEIITDESVCNRTIRHDDGPVQHELRIPKRVAQAGLDHTRRFSSGDYRLTVGAMANPNKTAETIFEGTALQIVYPIRKAILSVELPPGFEPRSIRAYACPIGLPPDPELSTTVNVHCSTELRGGRVVASVRQLHLPIGFRLFLLWGLP